MGAHRVRIGLAAVVAAMLALGVVSGSPVAAIEGPVVSMGDQSGLERDDVIGSIFMPVTLSEASTEPVVVNYYTVNGTAIYIPPEDRDVPSNFGDYQRRGIWPPDPIYGGTRSVTIPAGALQTWINIPINIDDEVEPDETFFVVIQSVSGGGATIGNDTGTATIIDADGVSAANPAINVSSGAIFEGDAGERRAQFLIHLSRAAGSNVTVAYNTQDGSAVGPGDYKPKFPGTVNFAPGQISKTIDVLIDSNTTVDGARDFQLNVSVTGGAPVEELNMTGVMTIVDDDSPTVAEPVPQLAAGNNHTCALRADGVVRCWGDNSLGQLGDGTPPSDTLPPTPMPTPTPVTVTGLPADIVSIASGDAQSCALTSGGAVKCWGNNADGQLGDGTQTTRETPVDVVGLSSGVSAIGAGDNHTCAGLAAGGVKCWGWASSGQLGNGSLIGRSLAPIDVQGLPAGAVAVEISAGYRHTCATLDDTSTWCWGRNFEGQLGTGGNETRVLSAVQPTGLGAGTTAVAARGAHTCVVQLTGVKCMGRNVAGQLGDGTTTDRNQPVIVAGLTETARVAAGGSHSCALTTTGGVKCWGLNQTGQLGIDDPTTNNVTAPVDVVGLGSGQISVSAGGTGHTCSMATDGSVKCWGANGTGQLGNGNTTQSFAPIDVVGL